MKTTLLQHMQSREYLPRGVEVTNWTTVLTDRKLLPDPDRYFYALGPNATLDILGGGTPLRPCEWMQWDASMARYTYPRGVSVKTKEKLCGPVTCAESSCNTQDEVSRFANSTYGMITLSAGSELGSVVGGRCLGSDGDVDFEVVGESATNCLCEFSGLSICARNVSLSDQGPSWWIPMPLAKNLGRVCSYGGVSQHNALGSGIAGLALKGLEMIDANKDGDISLTETLEHARNSQPSVTHSWLTWAIEHSPCTVVNGYIHATFSYRWLQVVVPVWAKENSRNGGPNTVFDKRHGFHGQWGMTQCACVLLHHLLL